MSEPLASFDWRRAGRTPLIWLFAALVASLSGLTPVWANDEAKPLSLMLSSSRALCTANTLTEVRWSISGGTAPHALSLDGRRVSAAEGSAQVDCGPMPAMKPGETPTRQITAAVTDANGNTASASVRVPLAHPLSAPFVPEDVWGPSLAVFHTRAAVGWSRGVAHTDTHLLAAFYLARWRQSGSETWSFILARVDVNRLGHAWRMHHPNYEADFHLDDLQPGSTYEIAAAALRDELEQESPNALAWSPAFEFTTLKQLEDVRVSATHDTLTASWQAQPEATSYSVTATGPDGSKRQGLYVNRGSSGRHQVTLRGLPADTAFKVEVRLGVAEQTSIVEVDARTAVPPAGYTPLPRGPKNARMIASADAIRVSWNAPHEFAEHDYRVMLFDPEPKDGLGYAALVDDISVRGERPKMVTFSNLLPEKTYRIRLIHYGIYKVVVERTIRTPASDRDRLRSGEVPIPFGGDAVSFVWPLRFNDDLRLTADPWIWRALALDKQSPADRFHGGLDIGHMEGEAHIADEPVYAAADGVLRVFNNTVPRRYVLYCPPSADSPVAAGTAFPFQFIVDKHPDRLESGKLVCMYLVSPKSGRTVLIFHGTNGAGPRVTKYSHLAAIDKSVLQRLADDDDGAIDVKQGTRIGTVGRSGDAGESVYHAHLHFEIREFNGKVEGGWYTRKSDCNPEDFSVVLAHTEVIVNESTGEKTTTKYYRGYCGWSADRKLPTVLDPESVLPPLPAAGQPTGAFGQTKDAKNTSAFAVQSAYPAGLAPTGLRVQLDAQIWRPLFYDEFGDWEFVAPANGVSSRRQQTGTDGTRPGVTGYQPDGGGCLAPGTSLPAAALDEGEFTFTLQLAPGSACRVAIKSVNDSYSSGYDGFAHPQATLSLTNLDGGSTDRETKAMLSRDDFDFYQFRAVPGKEHRFCTILSADDDCSSQTAWQTFAGKDAVLEIWGAGGVVKHDGTDGESAISWKPEADQRGLYYLLVRGQTEPCDGPCGGSYTLRYTLPEGSGGADPPIRLLPELSIKYVKPTSGDGDWGVEATWAAPQSGDETGELRYEADVVAVGVPDVDAAVVGPSSGRFSERSWSKTGLAADQVIDVFIRAYEANRLVAAGSKRACLRPCEVVLSEVTTGGLQLSWTVLEPANDIELYHVRVRSGEQVVKSEYGSHDTKHVLSGLKLAGLTAYTAEVRLHSIRRGGWTEWTSTSFETPEAPQPDPLSLSVQASATTCLTGEPISVSWSVTGGSGEYAISVDGAKQAGGSASVECQATAGEQSVTVVATDAVHAELRAEQTLKLTAVASTVEATIWAQRLPDGRVEFVLRLADGKAISPGDRYLSLSQMTDGGWDETGTLSASFGGKSYSVGQISVRLDNTVCPGFLNFSVLPVSGERVTPTMHKFLLNAAVGQWFSTSAFTLSLAATTGSTSTHDAVRDEADGWMTTVDTNTSDTARADAEATCADSPSGLTTDGVSNNSIRLNWGAVSNATQYDVRRDGGESTELSSLTTSYEFSGFEPDTSYQLAVRARSELGASSWSGIQARTSATVVDPPTGLMVSAATTSLTLQWQGVSGATGYGVRIESGSETKLAATKTSHEFDGLSPNTRYTVEVRTYVNSDTSRWSSIQKNTAAIPPLTLTASASPTSCETGGEVTVSWTVGGGSGAHTVTVNGVEQSGGSVTLACQAQPGTQNVTVTATDAAAGVSPVTRRVELTVTEAVSQTVTAQIWAQRLADNRVEFQLRLEDGTELTTANRFMTLPEVKAGRWLSSSAFATTIDGTDYRLGVVSAQLDNTVCPAQVWVTFIPTGGERITPTRYRLPVDREANLWAVTSKFEVTLVKLSTSDAVRQGDAAQQMDAAPEGASPVPGREGGFMQGDAAHADTQREQSTVKTCTDVPTGLVTSNVTSSGARLSWAKVAGASEYDVAVDQEASTALDSTQLFYDFTGLAADTSHTLKVRARSWQGASEWSSKVVGTKASAVPVITIAAGTSPVDEGQGASFTLTSDRTLTAALTVKLSVTESGAMISGTPPTQVNIAQAAKSATLSVATADDEQDEDDSVVTATLLAGTGYQLGSAKSAAVAVADDDGQDPQLSLTLTSSSNSCETGGQVTVGWTVTGGSGSYTVTVDGAAQSGASTMVTCQATAGTQTVTVVATDQGDATLTKTETLDLTVTVPPLRLMASASPTSCDTGGQVTISWTVAGGSGAYTVTVDGAKQSGASATVSCQATAGTQTVTVVATDSADTKLTQTQQLKLTVTKRATTVQAKLRARRLADNRFELGLRLADGTDVSITKRFANPPSMTSGAWKQSETVSATIEGRSYTLGQLSVRLENDRCPSRLELSFLATGVSRLSPAQRFLRTDAKLETWFSGSEFTISLSASSSAPAQQLTASSGAAQHWLDDTPDATNAGPGTEGGSLSGETPSPVPDALTQAEAQSSGTPVCPDAPSGLSTSQITTNRISLSWRAVTGASQYDLRRGSTDLGFVRTNSYQFSGLSPDTSYQLQVRSRDAWGASAWSSVTQATLPELPDDPANLRVTATENSLTLSWDPAARATAYLVRIGAGSGQAPNQPPRGHEFTKLSPNTSYTLAVQASNRGGSSGWVRLTTKTKPEPVTLSASVSPTTCEPGDPLTLTWTAAGGSGSYRVTVDGSAQTGSSATLTCRETTGTQTITVVATDATHTQLSASRSLSVSVQAPPTVTGRMEARRVSSGRVEVAFRPQGGARILPSGRFYTPDVSKLNRWASSSDVYGPAGSETNRLLGQITVKHVLSGGKYYVDVCFRPAGASTRLCPTPNNFYYAAATEDRWHNTGTFMFTPLRAADGVRGDGAQSGTAQDELLQPPTPGEGDAVGTQGGLMSDQE